MKKSARQSMAWLHSWLGLLIGWFLFCIFLSGTLTYYRHELNLWSQPQLLNIQIHQNTAVESALQYLEKNAPDAQKWMIQIANHNNPMNKLYWQTQDGQFNTKILNPNTSQEIKMNDIPAGEFFYLFHFQLYGMPILTARFIVCCAAFIMLVTLISGIITHKKIFTDFFTLRAFKGQRSYLDFHNVSAVIALPFFLTITFTGLAILFYIFLPLSIQKAYPNNIFQFFEEIRTVPTLAVQNAQSSKMLTPAQMQALVTQELGDIELSHIIIQSPHTSNAIATFNALEDRSITQRVPQVTFHATTGQILQSTRNESMIATLSSGVYGIHMMTFAPTLLRVCLFFSGLLGCTMIASGLLLWSLKRQLQTQMNTPFHFGFYLVDRLNMSALLGLSTAVICYLFSFRFNQMFHLEISETLVFFSSWLAIFVLSLVISKYALWKLFLKLFILLSIMLLIIDLLYFAAIFQATASFKVWNIVRVDVLILIFIALATFLHRHLAPIQHRAKEKLRTKLKTTSSY